MLPVFVAGPQVVCQLSVKRQPPPPLCASLQVVESGLRTNVRRSSRRGLESMGWGVVSLRRCDQSVWFCVPRCGGRTCGQKHWGHKNPQAGNTSIGEGGPWVHGPGGPEFGGSGDELVTPHSELRWGTGSISNTRNNRKNRGRSSLPQADAGSPPTATPRNVTTYGLGPDELTCVA